MLELSKTPNTSKYLTHYYCDYVEMLALGTNEPISSSDISARMGTDQPDTTSMQDEFASEDELGGVAQGKSGYCDSQDANESWIHSLLDHVKIRMQEYGDSYPFQFDSNTISLKGELNEVHHMYIFLLLCSSQQCIDSSVHSTIETDFELVCEQAIKTYLPETAKVLRFGKSADSGDPILRGTLKEKINRLANLMKKKTIYEDRFFGPNNTGDGGLDIVTWSPIPGDTSNDYLQVNLVQCATGKNWMNKQHDPMRFIKYIEGLGNAQITMFNPYDCRDASRYFVEEPKLIIANPVFDRLRILNMLADKMQFFTELSSHAAAVVRAIEYREPLV